MIFDLEESAAVDPKRVGVKAAALALARQAGLPVLPGFVVETSASLRHMEIGRAALSGRGSGGARLAVIAEPIPDLDGVVSAARRLGGALVARSSSPLDGGLWAGAFATYVDISAQELSKAVVGCWASAFTVDALGRHGFAGVEPGSVGMAVLVQPAIGPECGGVAEIDRDGAIVVEGVAGSPAPLLQGWERGVTAHRPAGGEWAGDEAIALIGEELLDEVGSVLAAAAARFGVNRCEWGFADRVWLLQLGTATRPARGVSVSRPSTQSGLIPVVRAMLAVPGSEPMSASTRVGVRSWEPLVAAIVLDHGTVFQGAPAAPGIGAGLRHHLDHVGEGASPRRAVVTADRPLPQLSQLIWDAAGLVTGAGSPAAHLFQAARSLGIPAVCGVDLSGNGDLIVAVDGHSGRVASLPLGSEG